MRHSVRGVSKARVAKAVQQNANNKVKQKVHSKFCKTYCCLLTTRAFIVYGTGVLLYVYSVFAAIIQVHIVASKSNTKEGVNSGWLLRCVWSCGSLWLKLQRYIYIVWYIRV